MKYKAGGLLSTGDDEYSWHVNIITRNRVKRVLRWLADRDAGPGWLCGWVLRCQQIAVKMIPRLVANTLTRRLIRRH
jgi:hypothetical protein